MDRAARGGRGDIVVAEVVRRVSYVERDGGRAAGGRRGGDYAALDETRDVQSSRASDARLRAVSRAGYAERKDVRCAAARHRHVPALSSHGARGSSGELRRMPPVSRPVEIKTGQRGNDD